MPKRVTNEEVIAAYKLTGNVWKAGISLGIAGQTVWERLRAIGYKLNNRKWSDAEDFELRTLAGSMPIADIARRFGRTYASVSCRIGELRLSGNYGPSRKPVCKRTRKITAELAAELSQELSVCGGSITRFARRKGMRPDPLIEAFQRYQPEFWESYSRAEGMEERRCAYCERLFFAMNKKQRTCSRKCQRDMRSDHSYFNGRRSQTIGLAEGVCQLCLREPTRALSSHHAWGRENDHASDYLIALCAGCHELVGRLGSSGLPVDRAFYERLIILAELRRNGGCRPLGFYVEVGIDELTEADLEETEAA